MKSVMKSRIVTLFAAAIVLALGACASLTPTEPFAVIDGTDWDRTDPYAAPVQIASIDSKDYLRLSRRALPPGPHKIGFLTTQVLRAQKGALLSPEALQEADRSLWEAIRA